MRHATATPEQPSWEERKSALKARAAAEGYPPYVTHGEMLSLLDEIPAASSDRLHDIQTRAASDYTSRSLWPKRPSHHPGDRSLEAALIRRQTAEIAERVWLAAEDALVLLTFGR